MPQRPEYPYYKGSNQGAVPPLQSWERESTPPTLLIDAARKKKAVQENQGRRRADGNDKFWFLGSEQPRKTHSGNLNCRESKKGDQVPNHITPWKHERSETLADTCHCRESPGNSECRQDRQDADEYNQRRAERRTVYVNSKKNKRRPGNDPRSRSPHSR